MLTDAGQLTHTVCMMTTQTTHNETRQNAPRKNKATYSGHCQLCGHLQKLPGNNLSKHGYTVEHGYFSGICRGSHALPFELSYHLVLDEIETATLALEALNARIAYLRTHVDADTKMWVRTYATINGLKKYIWEPVTLSAAIVTRAIDNWTSVVYSYVEHGGREVRSDFQGQINNGVKMYEMRDADAETLRRATILRHNTVYANWLQHETTSLTRYIAWQQARVTSWTEQPLLPVDMKDKTGFVPTPAPY